MGERASERTEFTGVFDYFAGAHTPRMFFFCVILWLVLSAHPLLICVRRTRASRGRGWNTVTISATVWCRRNICVACEWSQPALTKMVAVLFVTVVVTFYTIHHHQSIHPYEVYEGGVYVPGLVRLLLYVVRFRVVQFGVVQFLGCTGLVSCWGFWVSFDTTSCSDVGKRYACRYCCCGYSTFEGLLVGFSRRGVCWCDKPSTFEGMLLGFCRCWYLFVWKRSIF